MKRILAIVMLAVCICVFKSCDRDIPPFRLHVIANSDSVADQTVKLKVRDAVIAELSEMQYVHSREEAAIAAEARMNDIIAVANAVLKENGMEYTAKGEVGVFAFPEKEYSGKVYPAGDYLALRIVLGEGEGQNWWCVLFPPLCLVEAPECEDPQVKSAFIEWLRGLAREEGM